MKNGDESIHYFEKFSMDECGDYLQYKRVAKDPAMSKNISKRRKHCLDVMHWDSPFGSLQNSDNKDGVEERDEAEHAVVTLIGMGQGGEEMKKEEEERECYEWEGMVWIVN